MHDFKTRLENLQNIVLIQKMFKRSFKIFEILDMDL